MRTVLRTWLVCFIFKVLQLCPLRISWVPSKAAAGNPSVRGAAGKTMTALCIEASHLYFVYFKICLNLGRCCGFPVIIRILCSWKLNGTFTALRGVDSTGEHSAGNNAPIMLSVHRRIMQISRCVRAIPTPHCRRVFTRTLRRLRGSLGSKCAFLALSAG